MIIEIRSEDQNKIKTHGEKDYPFECCGFLLGHEKNGVRYVQMVKAVENARESKNRHNRYLIPPAEYVAAEKMAAAKGLDVIGFYHSHPDAEAQPSLYDLEHSWPWYTYLIVSVKNRKAGDMTGWRLLENRSQFEQDTINQKKSEEIEKSD
jgi:proteasome lid subunit RPN8/RPN11